MCFGVKLRFFRAQQSQNIEKCLISLSHMYSVIVRVSAVKQQHNSQKKYSPMYLYTNIYSKMSINLTKISFITTQFSSFIKNQVLEKTFLVYFLPFTTTANKIWEKKAYGQLQSLYRKKTQKKMLLEIYMYVSSGLNHPEKWGSGFCEENDPTVGVNIISE